MGYLTIVIVLSLLSFSLVFGSACTDACNGNYTTGVSVTFCSQKLETYTTKVSALYTINSLYASCYANCGVAVLYVGVCGCPNDCYNTTNHGQCNLTSTGKNECKCNEGWGGKDCSIIKCPSSCSGHGACVTQSSSKGGDYCQCQAGYTSHDCSVKIPDYFVNHPYGELPFGEVSGDGEYYKNDKYLDSHPVFNYSTVATVKLTVSNENLEYMLNPAPLYDVEYMDAKLFFYNGNISKSTDVTFRLKGYSSRLYVKKSWNIKFADDYKDLKGFSLKTNTGDRQVSSQVIIDIYRSQKVQTYHHAHAQLFINDISFGVFSLEERIDDAWMKSRFAVNEKKGANMYKFTPFDLRYMGATVDDYRNYTVPVFNNWVTNVIAQEEGNGDWNDLLDLILALNSSTSIAVEYMQENFNTKGLLKAWMLETAFKNSDSDLGTSNNWQIVDSKEQDPVQWEYIAFDFDLAILNSEKRLAPFFGLTVEQFVALLDAGVTVFRGIDISNLIQPNNPYIAINKPGKPLPRVMLSYPGANDTFTAVYKEMVKQVIIDHPGRAEEIRQANYDLIHPLMSSDLLYMISNTASGNSIVTFESQAQESKEWIAERWAYLASMFYVNNNGQCDALGNCVCFENYSGENCEIYTPPPTPSPTPIPTLSPTPSPTPAAPSCPLSVSFSVQGEWVNGETTNNRLVAFSVHNPTSSNFDSVTLRLKFSGESYISQSWNINPSTTPPYSSFVDISLSLFSLSPGQTASSSGVILTSQVPSVPSFTIESVVC